MQEAARREKRRLLDAQRGKCRVRLGCHLEEWCALKDQLGFSLHSQLAKFLLDSYRATKGLGISAPKANAYLSVSPASLHHLAFLCHQHGGNCDSPPTLLSPPHCDTTSEAPVLLWGCKQDHHFEWDPHKSTEMKANLAGIKTNAQESQSTDSYKTKEKEKDPQKNTKERVTESSSMALRKHKKILQLTDLEPEDIVTQEKFCEKLTEGDWCPDANAARMSENLNINNELTENVAEETQKKTSGNKYKPLNSNIIEKGEDHIVDNEQQSHNAMHALETKNPVNGPGQQTVVFAEDIQECVSIDLERRKHELLTHSDNTSKHRRCNLQVSESHIQVVTAEGKAELSLPCRRSLRGSKVYNVKEDELSPFVEQSREVCSNADETQDSNIDTPLSIDKGTETSTELFLVEESITTDGTEKNTLSEDLHCFAEVDQQKKSSPGETGNTLHGEQSQKPGAASELGQTFESQEQQDNQSSNLRASRRKPYIDEELAQICKKRIRKATPPELLMCEFDDCGKIFSKRQYLNYHQKYQHMNQRMFRCSVTECGKTFNFKKHLKEHEKRHSDRRDFICEFCARAFRSSSNLIIHRRIHTGEKPLQCEFCGFTCRQKASLNWHMKKHNADSLYKFPCEICGQRFEKRDNLAAHMSRKHPAPQVTVSNPTDQCNAPSTVNVSECDPNSKAECPERPAMVQTSNESVKEALYSNYLDLSESMHEAAPQTVQSSENTEISLVIVL